MTKKTSKTAEAKKVANATVANNEAVASVVTNKAAINGMDLMPILGKANTLDSEYILASFVFAYFIQLVAKNYLKFFKDAQVASLVSIGVNYEDRYLTTYDVDGTPIESEFDEGNYSLPEFNDSFDKWDEEGYYYDPIFDFLNDVNHDEGDTEARNETIKFFEKYLSAAWNFKEVKLVFDCGFFKVDVIH